MLRILVSSDLWNTCVFATWCFVRVLVELRRQFGLFLVFAKAIEVGMFAASFPSGGPQFNDGSGARR